MIAIEGHAVLAALTGREAKAARKAMERHLDDDVAAMIRAPLEEATANESDNAD
jgi:DNA-binding GntR family transcriptional regulator